MILPKIKVGQDGQDIFVTETVELHGIQCYIKEIVSLN